MKVCQHCGIFYISLYWSHFSHLCYVTIMRSFSSILPALVFLCRLKISISTPPPPSNSNSLAVFFSGNSDFSLVQNKMYRNKHIFSSQICLAGKFSRINSKCETEIRSWECLPGRKIELVMVWRFQCYNTSQNANGTSKSSQSTMECLYVCTARY